MLFRDELESLARRGDAEILLSVDGTQGKPWAGKVGVVTELLDQVELDVLAHLRRRLRAAGVLQVHAGEARATGASARHRIYLSLERRMECGVGKCGHCAVGYTFTCLHGPVFSYWDAINLPELIYT